jgi:hypothetical protein
MEAIGEEDGTPRRNSSASHGAAGYFGAAAASGGGGDSRAGSQELDESDWEGAVECPTVVFGALHLHDDDSGEGSSSGAAARYAAAPEAPVAAPAPPSAPGQVQVAAAGRPAEEAAAPLGGRCDGSVDPRGAVGWQSRF